MNSILFVQMYTKRRDHVSFITLDIPYNITPADSITAASLTASTEDNTYLENKENTNENRFNIKIKCLRQVNTKI